MVAATPLLFPLPLGGLALAESPVYSIRRIYRRSPDCIVSHMHSFGNEVLLSVKTSSLLAVIKKRTENKAASIGMPLDKVTLHLFVCVCNMET